MTRGKKRSLVRISQNRRDHVIQRLNERFGENINIKNFFNSIKSKDYEVLKELKCNRLLCLSNFCNKDIYMIIKYTKNKKEVSTVLTETMVLNRYASILEEESENFKYKP